MANGRLRLVEQHFLIVTGSVAVRFFDTLSRAATSRRQPPLCERRIGLLHILHPPPPTYLRPFRFHSFARSAWRAGVALYTVHSCTLGHRLCQPMTCHRNVVPSSASFPICSDINIEENLGTEKYCHCRKETLLEFSGCRSL